MMDAGAGARAVRRDWRRRLRQGIRSLLAPLLPLELTPARAILSDAQFALFRQLRRDEQLHALRVLATVREQPGETPLALARAALLHDVGKLRYPLSVFGKTWAVLLRDIWPRAAARWGAGGRVEFWRRPQRVLSQHPAWGAEMAAAAGVAECTCWLIAEHQTPVTRWATHPDRELLRRLQAADRDH